MKFKRIKKYLIFTVIILLAFFYGNKLSRTQTIEVKSKSIEIENASLNEITKNTVEVKRIKNASLISNVLFLGDSRTVGLQLCDFKNFKVKEYDFFCEIGKGYSWLQENEKNLLPKYKNTDAIIVNLGINDLGNIEQYNSYFSELSKTTTIYYISINPVEEKIASEHGYSINNEEIEYFNQKIMENKDLIYIDSYQYLIDSGFETIDGIHYDIETYQKILDFINIKLDE